MGFALSITTAILLIAALLMIAMFYPTLSQSTDELTEARGDWYELRLSEQNTALEVYKDGRSNAKYSLKPDSYDYDLYNCGETPIDLEKLIILENGEYSTTQMFPEGTQWLYPSGRVALVGLSNFSTGSLKFVCANGATLTVEITE
ncbi:MAG: hypothetical protein ACXQS4_00575 [Methermicoccaceae archaeon]